MGMYNEVFKACPKCSGMGYAQIGELVSGFGGFDLDSPESLAEELTEDQLLSLKESVSGLWFECQSCEHSFQIEDEEDKARRLALAKELFG